MSRSKPPMHEEFDAELLESLQESKGRASFKNLMLLVMLQDKEGYKVIRKSFKHSLVADQIVQYVKCTRPNLAFEAGVGSVMHYEKVVHDCSARLLCDGFGKLCKGPEGEGGKLTRIETSVFFLSCKGMPDREIAEILGLPKCTIEVFQQAIRYKLMLESRADYILFAIEQGYQIDPNLR